MAKNRLLAPRRLVMRSRLCTLLSLCGALSGCDSGAGGNSRQRTIPALWDLDLRRSTELVAAADEPLFRVSSAGILNDSVFLLEASSNRIRVAGPDGVLSRSIGGTGEGPGEFVEPRGLLVRGKEVMVWDGTLDKLVSFPEGREESVAVHSTRWRGETRIGLTMGVLGDGRIVLSEAKVPMISVERPKIWQGSGILTVLDPASGDTASAGEFAFSATYHEPLPNSGTRSMGLLFGAKSGLVVGSDFVAVVGRDNGAIEIRNPMGQVLALAVDSLASRRPVSDADWQAATDELLSRGQPSPTLRETIARMPRADSMPYWGWQGNPWIMPLRIDRADRIWALQFGVKGDAQQIWTVFAPRGEVLARVRIADEANILGFGEQDVILQLWNADGVERVLRVRLPAGLQQ